MRQRGRKSAAEAAAPAPLRVIAEPRLPPPPDLAAAELETWQKIVASRPARWFDAGSAPTLRSLVAHIGHAATLDAAIAAALERWPLEAGGTEGYLSLLAAREKTTRAICACSRALRLTAQSLHPTTAARRVEAHAEGAGRRPWE